MSTQLQPENTIKVLVGLGEKKSLFVASAEQVQQSIVEIVKSNLTKQPDTNVSPEQKQFALLMRTTLKGTLMVAGDPLMKMLYGPDRPRIQRGDDPIEFYTIHAVTRAITLATNFVFVFQAGKEHEFGQEQPILVTEVRAVPISQSTGEPTSGQGTGTGDGQELPCKDCQH